MPKKFRLSRLLMQIGAPACFRVLSVLGLLLASMGVYAQSEDLGDANRDAKLWVNLREPTYYTREHLYLNEMRNAYLPWVPLVYNEFNTFSPSSDADDQQYVLEVMDSNGYPSEIPESVDAVGVSLMFTNGAVEEADSLGGRYKLIYEGTGTIQLYAGGSPLRETAGNGWMEFDYDPDTMPYISIQILATADGGRHIKNLAVYRLDFEDKFEAGRVVNPLFAEKWGNVKVIRFMGHTFTNRPDEPVATWANRSRPEYYTYHVPLGISIEDIVAISNELGIDPWINIPHTADPIEYTEPLAEYVRDNLDPERRVYFEYSNEIWNWAFNQTQWVNNARLTDWGENGDWVSYGCMLAARHMDVITEVFAGQMSRISRVAAVQAAWPEMGESCLDSTYYVNEVKGIAPKESFDALAITGYFYADDPAALQAALLERLASGQYTQQENFDWIDDFLYDNIAVTISNLWDRYKLIAHSRGLDLLMYEGGTHVGYIHESSNDAALFDFFDAFSYSENMGDLYAALIAQWEALDVEGGFMHFATVEPSSPFGFWGAQRHLDDINPRYDILMKYNRGEFP